MFFFYLKNIFFVETAGDCYSISFSKEYRYYVFNIMKIHGRDVLISIFMESFKYLVWLKHLFYLTILYIIVTFRPLIVHMLPQVFLKNGRHEHYIIVNDFCKVVCIYEKQSKNTGILTNTILYLYLFSKCMFIPYKKLFLNKPFQQCRPQQYILYYGPFTCIYYM